MIYCLQKKENIINSIDFLEIEDVIEDILITKDKYLRVLKIQPINYDLKSDFEKKAIIEGYKTVLKTCNFNFQILILSQKEKIDKNLEVLKQNLSIKADFLNKEKIFYKKESEMENLKKQENIINKLYKNYINFIEKINSDENITSKSFYIIIAENKIKEKENVFELLKFKKIKRNKNKQKKDSLLGNKEEENSLHKYYRNEENKNVFIIKKALDDKEKKLKLSLEKSGNFIKRLEKEELYEMLIF